MENVNLKDVDFIIPVRIENIERLLNINIQKQFFENTIDNLNIIYVEHGPTQKVINSHFIETRDPFNKSLCYNTGVKLSKRKYICLIDTDVLINPLFILQSTHKKDICISYNKTCLYLNFKAKELIRNNLTLFSLIKLIPQDFYNENNEIKTINRKLGTFTTHEFFMLPHNDCIGGCLVMDKQTFYDIKGFNTNFTEWGYEDNEIITRAEKLGKTVTHIDDNNAFLYHLPHESTIITSSKLTPASNKVEMEKINSMNKLSIEQYISNWNI